MANDLEKVNCVVCGEIFLRNRAYVDRYGTGHAFETGTLEYYCRDDKSGLRNAIRFNEWYQEYTKRVNFPGQFVAISEPNNARSSRPSGNVRMRPRREPKFDADGKRIKPQGGGKSRRRKGCKPAKKR